MDKTHLKMKKIFKKQKLFLKNNPDRRGELHLPCQELSPTFYPSHFLTKKDPPPVYLAFLPKNKGFLLRFVVKNLYF